MPEYEYVFLIFSGGYNYMELFLFFQYLIDIQRAEQNSEIVSGAEVR